MPSFNQYRNVPTTRRTQQQQPQNGDVFSAAQVNAQNAQRLTQQHAALYSSPAPTSTASRRAAANADVIAAGKAMRHVQRADGTLIPVAAITGDDHLVSDKGHFTSPTTGERFIPDPTSRTGLSSIGTLREEMAAKAAEKQAKIDAATAKEAAKIAVDAEKGTAKAMNDAAKLANAQATNKLLAQGRAYNIDRVTGAPIPKQSDEEFANDKALRMQKLQQEAAAKPYKKRLDELELELSNPDLPKVSDKDIEDANEGMKSAASSLMVARGNEDFSTPISDEELQQALTDPLRQESAAKYVQAKKNADELPKAAAARKALEREAFETKKRILDPLAYTEDLKSKVKSEPSQDLSIRADEIAARVEARKLEHEQKAAEIQKKDEELSAQHSYAKQRYDEALANGADAATIGTLGGALQDLQQQASEWQGNSEDQRLALQAEGAEINRDIEHLNIIGDESNKRQQAAVAQQSEALEKALPGAGKEYTAALEDGKQRAAALKAKYPDGPESSPEAKAAFDAFQQDIQGKVEVITKKAQAKATERGDDLKAARIAIKRDGFGADTAESMAKSGLDPKNPKHKAAYFDANALLNLDRPTKALWQPGDNIPKGFGSTTLSDGALHVSPEFFHDSAKYAKVVDASDASDEEKANAMLELPKLKLAFAESVLPILKKAGTTKAAQWIPGIASFQKWQSEKTREGSEVEQASQYLEEMSARGGWSKGADNVLRSMLAGFSDYAVGKIGSLALSLGNETLSNAAASWSKESSDFMQAAALEGADSTYSSAVLGQVARMAGPMGFDILITRGLGGGLGTFAAMAATQTAGSQYAEAYGQLREEGKSHKDAWKQTAPYALASGLVTAMLTAAGGRTGFEAALGAKKVAGQALTAAEKRFERKALEDAAKGFWWNLRRNVPKQALAEIPEEFPDEIFSQISQALSTDPNADINQVVGDFMVNAPAFLGAIALLGGAGGVMETRKAFPKGGNQPAPTDLDETDAGVTLPEDQAAAAAGIAAWTPKGAIPSSIQDAAKAAYGKETTPEQQTEAARTTAQAILDIASGQDPRAMSPEVRRMLGIKVNSKDGSIEPASKSVMPLVESVVDSKGVHQPVITDAARDWITRELPDAGAQVKLSYAERVDQIKNPKAAKQTSAGVMVGTEAAPEAAPEAKPASVAASDGAAEGVPLNKRAKQLSKALQARGVAPDVANSYAAKFDGTNKTASTDTARQEMFDAFEKAGGKFPGESQSHIEDAAQYIAAGMTPDEAANAVENAKYWNEDARNKDHAANAALITAAPAKDQSGGKLIETANNKADQVIKSLTGKPKQNAAAAKTTLIAQLRRYNGKLKLREATITGHGAAQLLPDGVVEVDTAKLLEIASRMKNEKRAEQYIIATFRHEIIHLAAISTMDAKQVLAMWKKLPPALQQETLRLYNIAREEAGQEGVNMNDFQKGHEYIRALVEADVVQMLSEQAFDTGLKQELLQFLADFLDALRNLAKSIKDPSVRADVEKVRDTVKASYLALEAAIDAEIKAQTGSAPASGSEKGGAQSIQTEPAEGSIPAVAKDTSIINEKESSGESSPFAANKPSVPLKATIQVKRGKKTIPFVITFPNAESAEAYQWDDDYAKSISQSGTVAGQKAKARVDALIARLMESTWMSDAEVRLALSDYHSEINADAQRSVTSRAAAYKPKAFVLAPKAKETTADTLPEPEEGDIISFLKTLKINRIGPPDTSDGWAWYQQLQRDAANSKLKASEAQKAARNGDITDTKAKLAWLHDNLVSLTGGRAIDEAADELTNNDIQEYPISSGDELGQAILAALDARLAAKNTPSITDQEAAMEGVAIADAENFATYASGSTGKAFTAAELSQEIEAEDELKIGNEFFTVIEVDAKNGEITLESSRFGSVTASGDQVINLTAGPNHLRIGKQPIAETEDETLGASPSRARESMTFDPPFNTRFGDILSYEWMSQAVGGMDSYRVSDWNQARTNPATGREIVHHFKVRKPDGIHTVSLETALGQLTKNQRRSLQGIIKAEQQRRAEAASGQMTLLASPSANDSRFNELTASLPDVMTEEDIAAFKRDEPEKYAELEAMRETVLKAGGWDEKVFHGTDEQRTELQDGVFTATDKSEASDYAELAALKSKEDEMAETLYEIMDEEGAESLTDLSIDTLRTIAKDNGVDVSNLRGFVHRLQAKLGKVLDLTDVGSETSKVRVEWDMLHEKGLLDEAWADIDPEFQEELRDKYNGKALYRLFEEEGIYDKAFALGYDSVMFEDQGVTGRTKHISFITKKASQLKSRDPLAPGPKIPPSQWGDASKDSILFASPSAKNHDEKTDRRAQAKWIDEQAKGMGISADSLVLDQPDAFSRMALRWRFTHPQNKAGNFVQNASIRAIVSRLYGKPNTTDKDTLDDRAGAARTHLQSAAADASKSDDAKGHFAGDGETPSGLAANGAKKASAIVWKRWLKEFAEPRGILLAKMPRWIEKLMHSDADAGQSEHHVFDMGARVLKITKGTGASFGLFPKATPQGTAPWTLDYHGSPYRYLQKMHDANMMFGDDIVLHAVVHDNHGNTNLILSQPKYDLFEATTGDIQEAMKASGFIVSKSLPSAFYRPADNAAVVDFHLENGGISPGPEKLIMPFDVTLFHPKGALREAIAKDSGVEPGPEDADRYIPISGNVLFASPDASPPSRLWDSHPTDPASIANATRLPKRGLDSDPNSITGAYFDNAKQRAKAGQIIRTFERDWKPFFTYIDDTAPYQKRVDALRKIVNKFGHDQTSPESRALWESYAKLDHTELVPEDTERVKEAKELLPYIDNLTLGASPSANNPNTQTIHEIRQQLQQDDAGRDEYPVPPERLQAQAKSLLHWATNSGREIDRAAIERATNRHNGLAGGEEHDVWLPNAADGRVIKLTKKGVYGIQQDLTRYLDTIAESNSRFGDDIIIEGVVQIDGWPHILISQPFYVGTMASPKEIDGYFKDAGYTKTNDGMYKNAAGDIVYDAFPRNVLKLTNGAIMPMDVQVRLAAEQTLGASPSGYKSPTSMLAATAQTMQGMKKPAAPEFATKDLHAAYRRAIKGSSSLMLPMRKVFDAAKHDYPQLSAAEFMSQVKADYYSGLVMLEPSETQGATTAAGAFTLRDSLGLVNTGMSFIPTTEDEMIDAAEMDTTSTPDAILSEWAGSQDVLSASPSAEPSPGGLSEAIVSIFNPVFRLDDARLNNRQTSGRTEGIGAWMSPGGNIAGLNKFSSHNLAAYAILHGEDIPNSVKRLTKELSTLLQSRLGEKFVVNVDIKNGPATYKESGFRTYIEAESKNHFLAEPDDFSADEMPLIVKLNELAIRLDSTFSDDTKYYDEIQRRGWVRLVKENQTLHAQSVGKLKVAQRRNLTDLALYHGWKLEIEELPSFESSRAAGGTLGASPSAATPESTRHAELEAKFNAGTITAEETAEAQRIVDAAEEDAGFEKMFHGNTRERTGRVASTELGVHFGDEDAANNRLEQTGQDEGVVNPYWVKIENPVVLKYDPAEWMPHQVVEALPKPVRDKLEESYEYDYTDIDNAELKLELQKQGFDGIKYPNAFEGGVSYVAFERSQFHQPADPITRAAGGTSPQGFTNLDPGARTGGFLNADILAEGAALIQQGFTTFAAWSKAMLQRFGQGIRQYLAGVWQHALRASEVGAINPQGTGKRGGLLQRTKAQTKAGRTVGSSNPTSLQRTGEGTDANHNVELSRLRANNPQAYRKNALLLTRYPIVAREQPDLAGKMRKIDQPVENAQAKVDAANAGLKAAKYTVQKAVGQVLKKKTAKVKAAEVDAFLEANPGKRLTGAVRRQQALVAALTAKLDQAKEKQAEALADLLDSRSAVTLDKADAIYESYITAVESNLETLIKLFPKKLRDIARLWYDGANIIAQNFGRRFGATLEQASAVLAVFSPQKDWFMNVSLAERMMSIWKNDQDTVWSAAMSEQFLMRSGEPQPKEDKETGEIVYDQELMDEWNPEGIKYQKGARPGPPDANGNTTWINWDNAKDAEAVQKARLIIALLEGRTLREIVEPELKARFIRMLSEVRDSPHYPKVSPDGRPGGLMTNDKGVRIKIAWGGYNTIEKAISIMQATTENEHATISEALGEQHKVRSFYNNIADPANTSGHVTMDTHAVAALLWLPLSGASVEVTQNFGGAGVQNDGGVGIKGMYAANAEAYRRAGAAFGLLPREVQSITWEAVRLLFPAKWKSNKANVAKVRAVWNRYLNHELSIEQARAAVFEIAAEGRNLARAISDGSGVGNPAWSAEMGDGALDSGDAQNANDAGELSANRGTGRPGSGRGAGGIGSERGGRDRAAVVSPAPTGRLGGFTNLDPGARTGGFLNADILAEGAALIQQGFTTFATWSRAMLQRFGQGIRDSLTAIWQQITSPQTNAAQNARLGLPQGTAPVTVGQGGFVQGNETQSRFASAATPESTRHAELEAKHNSGTITPEETAEAQRLVDEAAKRAGYEAKWHGSYEPLMERENPVMNTQRRGGYWVADTQERASYHGNAERVFIRFLYPLDVELDTIESPDEDAINSARNSGYDALLGPQTGDQNGGQIFLFHPSQIKSADPFTGVPLDQRFNPDSDSILSASPSAKRAAKRGPIDPTVANQGDTYSNREAFTRARASYVTNELDKADFEQISAEQDQRIEEDEAGVLDDIQHKVADGVELQLEDEIARRKLANRLRTRGVREGDKATVALADSLWGQDIREATETARKLAARVDKAQSPQERLDSAMGRIIAPNMSKLRARISKAWTPNQKRIAVARLKEEIASAQTDLDRERLQRTLAEIQARKDQDEIIAQITEENNRTVDETLNRIGLTQADLSLTPDERHAMQVSIMDAPTVKKFIAAQSDVVRKAIEMVVRGYTDAAIARDTGIPVGKVSGIAENFRNNVAKPAIAQLVTVGKHTFGSIIESGKNLIRWILGASPAPLPGMIAKGVPNAASVNAQVQAILNAAIPTSRQRNRKMLHAAVVNGKKGQKITVFVAFDPTDWKQVYRAARELSTRESSMMDKMYEYWINGILSGPQTHVVNTASNLLSTAWHYGPQWFASATANSFVRDPNSTQWGEFKHVWAGFLKGISPALENFALAWSAEADPIEYKYLDQSVTVMFHDNSFEKAGGGRAPTIGGATGRVVRVPGRFLVAMDAFAKTLIMHGEASAFAYRTAKRKGYAGVAMTNFIAHEIATMGSDSWIDALKVAKELTFQDENEITEAVESATNALKKNKYMGLLFRFLLPFVRTPTNIYRAGMRKAGGSAGVMLWRLGKAGMASRGKNGVPFFDTYSKGKLVQDVSESVMAGIMWFGLMVLAAAEGDEDDEENWITITGSRPYGVANAGERASQYRQEGGSNLIIIRKNPITGAKLDKPIIINYGRLEPLALTVGTLTDAARELKEWRRLPAGDQTANRLAGTIMAHLASQAQDKTFLQGISGVLEIIDKVTSGRLEPGHDMAKFLIAGAIPNLIRQPLRQSTRELVDSKKPHTILGSSILASTLADGESKINELGQPATRRGSMIGNILFPGSTEPSHSIVDAALKNWNTRKPGELWNPDTITKGDWYIYDPAEGSKKGKYPLKESRQITLFEKMVGIDFAKRAAEGLAGAGYRRGANATAEHIAIIKKARETAIKTVRQMHPSAFSPRTTAK